MDPGAVEAKVYVDGKPRYEGVRSFLASRALSLSQGTPEDLREHPDREVPTAPFLSSARHRAVY
jgi:hypothetical protein